LGGLHPPYTRNERRAERRFAYPHLVHLTPVDPDTLKPVGQPLVVVGKQLSESGLGFYHREPLPHRRVIASLELPEGGWLGLLLDIAWCRFGRQGWYDSGGRFLQVMPSPLADDDPLGPRHWPPTRSAWRG
jgi:hypothetical protein